MNLGQVWEELVDCICRPPRCAEWRRASLPQLSGSEANVLTRATALLAQRPCRDLRANAAVCRRDDYGVGELLGGGGGRFTIGSQLCVREDLTLVRPCVGRLEALLVAWIHKHCATSHRSSACSFSDQYYKFVCWMRVLSARSLNNSGNLHRERVVT